MYSNNKLKFYREQAEMKLYHLSKVTGLSQGYLCHLEKGTRNNPSIKVMEKISKALNKSIGEIFFNE